MALIAAGGLMAGGLMACTAALPSADASRAGAPTASGSAAATLSAAATPTASAALTPSPTADPTLPAASSGRWTGVVDDPDDPSRSQVTLVLEACAPNGGCGSLELRQVNGSGCTYELDAAPPAGDALVYALVNAGSIDCEDAWSSSELLIRPTPTGGLAVSRVFEEAVDRSFTLDPATPSSAPSLAPTATADRTTVRRGQTLTVTVSGFGARSDVWITFERSSVLLGKAIASDSGAAVVVVRIPSGTPVGHDSILVEGFDRNEREFGLLIPIAVTK